MKSALMASREAQRLQKLHEESQRKEAKACLRQSCGSEGTHRIDLLVDGVTTRLTVYACEHHYSRAKVRWESMVEMYPILHCWFRGRCS